MFTLWYAIIRFHYKYYMVPPYTITITHFYPYWFLGFISICYVFCVHFEINTLCSCKHKQINENQIKQGTKLRNCFCPNGNWGFKTLAPKIKVQTCVCMFVLDVLNADGAIRDPPVLLSLSCLSCEKRLQHPLLVLLLKEPFLSKQKAIFETGRVVKSCTFKMKKKKKTPPSQGTVKEHTV